MMRFNIRLNWTKSWNDTYPPGILLIFPKWCSCLQTDPGRLPSSSSSELNQRLRELTPPVVLTAYFIFVVFLWIVWFEAGS